MKNMTFKFALAAGCALSLSAAQAHVSLEQPLAQAGTAYRAVLRVGHGCDGSATTGITVQLPAALKDAKPEARTGWDMKLQDGQVRWTAGKGAALASADKGEFVFNTALATQPGAVWLKVRQDCERGSSDWAELPASGTSTEGLKSPAVLLQVVSREEFAQRTAVKVEGAWLRPTVAGQQGTGGFMKLTAREAMQLVGVSTPVAGVAEVHEMKMEGSVMKMRPVGALDLPAGKTVELSPGGYHLMLMDLKQALAKDSVVPVTLVFKDAKGVQSRMELKVPVTALAPTGGHKH